MGRLCGVRFGPTRDRPDAQSRLADYRQGDLLTLPSFVHLEGGQTWRPYRKAARPDHQVVTTHIDGLVLVTQTCDIVRSAEAGRFLQAAPIVSAAGPTEAAAWNDGASSRYVAVPGIGPLAFVDLDRIVTLAPSLALRCSRRPGVQPDGRAVSRFGQAVARKFGRYPFPDDLGPSLKKLRASILHKWDRPDSPENHVLQALLQVRVESPCGGESGEELPVDVTLVFVMRAGFLPLNEEPAEASPALAGWLSGARTPAQLAARLADTLPHADRAVLLSRLVDEWVGLCAPQGVIRSITGEMVGADEYPLSRYWRSEHLDLDYLSGLTPDE